jgi:hypothetical protein
MDLVNNNDILKSLIIRAENNIVSDKIKYPFIYELVDCLENNGKNFRDIIKEKCEVSGDKHILFKFVMLYYTFLINDPKLNKIEIINKINSVISDHDLRITLMNLKLTN